MIGLVELIVVAVALISASVWLVSAISRASRANVHVSPSERAWRARARLYAPVWISLLVLVATLAPGLLSAITGAADHCMLHDHHHHHLCVVHPPHRAEGSVWVVVPLLATLLLSIPVGLTLRALLREWRLSRTLVAASSSSDLAADVRVLDCDEPIAAAVGLLRPQVFVSRGLLDGVSPNALKAILAHERAHVARRDPLKAALDRIAAALLPAPVRTVLLAELALAREQACDAIAAATVGSPFAVASALAETLRLRVLPAPVGVSITGGQLEARVSRLLEPPGNTRHFPPAMLATFGVAVVAFAAAEPLHALVEHIANSFLH